MILKPAIKKPSPTPSNISYSFAKVIENFHKETH
jgi:hypothetical protein